MNNKVYLCLCGTSKHTKVVVMHKSVELIREPQYAQSANSLFHFMKREEYLLSALNNKVLFPRYCIENIDYLGIEANGVPIKQVAILQKCFCDIPLHLLTKPLDLNCVDERGNTLTYDNRDGFLNNTHPGFYGNYAIAFSKEWCIKNNLQPVHYINRESSFANDFKKVFEHVLNMENVDDVIVDNIINRLAYIKPLQGVISRSENGQTVYYLKNFHDEKEWRYIPPKDVLSEKGLGSLIYKSILQNELDIINTRIASDEYLDIGLSFGYEDIRYLIVPTYSAKSNLLQFISDLFSEHSSEEHHKEELGLASKILVLEGIAKDW